ncbi:MAG: mechanosensitive ion channel [Cocleimonas sp.]|nr:mechanosensitive ion channel [Cocleimonas sp.]
MKFLSPQWFLLLVFIHTLLMSVAIAKKTDDPANIEEEERIVELFPLTLTPLWWEAFAQASPNTLATKVTQLKKDLEFITTPEKAQRLVAQIVVLLDQYQAKRNTPLVIKSSEKNEEKHRYFLDDIFSLVKQQKNSVSALLLLKTNQGILQKETKAKETVLNQFKLDYVKHQGADKIKLIKGLNWIKARLEYSILMVNNKLLEAKKDRLNKRLDDLKEEKKQSFNLLIITEKQIKAARLSAHLLAGDLKKTDNKLQHLENKERAITTTDKAATREKQRLSLQILETAQRRYNKSSAFLTYRLIDTIDQLKKNKSEQTRIKVREQLYKGLSNIRETEQWMEDVSDRVEKEENAANSQKAVAVEAVDKQYIEQRLQYLKSIYQLSLELETYQDKLKVLTSILDDQLGKTAGGAAIFVEKAENTLRNSRDNLSKWLRQSLFLLDGTPVTPIGLIRFFVILLVGWFFSRLFLRTIEAVNIRTEGGMQSSSIKTLSRIVSFVLVGVALLIAFSSLGIDVTKLALVASALSIGIGFGLQNIINNFVSGIILLFERSMKVGDYIEMKDGTRGVVKEINIRSTVINTNDNIDVVVPNSEFVNTSVTNWTMDERFMRLKIPFSVAYGTDKRLVRRIIIEAALTLDYTLNLTVAQHPQVRLSTFGESGLDFQLVVWIKAEWAGRPGRVKAAYNWEIETTLSAHGISIPFPQREVRLLTTS